MIDAIGTSGVRLIGSKGTIGEGGRVGPFLYQHRVTLCGATSDRSGEIEILDVLIGGKSRFAPEVFGPIPPLAFTELLCSSPPLRRLLRAEVGEEIVVIARGPASATVFLSFQVEDLIMAKPTAEQLDNLRIRAREALEAETHKTREERAAFLVRSLGTHAMVVAGWLHIESDALERDSDGDKHGGPAARVLALRELAAALEAAIEAEGV